MNIIVICSDTFRYDHLGFVGRHPVITPNLDKLARESASFTDFQLCSFPTVVNRIEVFSGRCAFPRVGWGPLPYHYPVMSQVFKRNGFTTALVADNVQVMKKEYNFSRGFDFVKHVRGQQHDDWLPQDAAQIELPCALEKIDASPKRLARYRRNAHWYRQQGTNATETVFREAMGWLKNAPKKFLLWIDSFDPHEPWDAPKRYLEKYPWNKDGAQVIWPHSGRANRWYSEADFANMRSLYRAEVTQTDYWIGELLEQIRSAKVLENTVVIFCSDHGHYFGEHNMIGKFMKKGADRPSTIYEEIGHIPLLIRHPSGLAACSEEFQKVSPRLKCVALVPFQDVTEAVKELRRAITELKLVGLMLPAVGLRLPLGHESFWPIYAEAEKLGCMVGAHATVRGPHYFAGDLFDQFIEVHTLSHSFAQMMQACSMMFRGVFERFPKLRVAFMEAGCSWAPYWFGRMNEEWEKRGEVEAPMCKRKPTDYLRDGRIYFHAEDYEPMIGATTQVLTHKVIYYASDYPHWDTEFPENIDHLGRREDLNDEAKKWLFAETAKKLYNLQ